MRYNLKNREKLLQDIAEGLRTLDASSTPIQCVEVALKSEGEIVRQSSLHVALDSIANDLYWDEQGDWSDADSAEVVVI